MHISDDHRKEAEKNHINVVIAGHIASDTLGINHHIDHVLKGVEVSHLRFQENLGIAGRWTRLHLKRLNTRLF